MPEQSTLDPQAILASLGITDVRQVDAVTGGSDTAIWRVEWQDAVYALRVFRQQMATFQREVIAMARAVEGGIPVPAIVRKGEWEGRPILLLSWVEGKTLVGQLQGQPYRIWQLGTAFGRMQAAIHRIPAPADMDATAWIEWTGDDEPELKARLLHLPSRKNRLLHLDYHPLNVMAQGGHISGVLDWANARAGDPRADFARTYAILRVEPSSPQDDHLLTALLRRLLERCWRVGYVQAGGQLDEMALFYAWAGASMIRDLSPKIGKTGFWLQDQHLDPVRKWRDEWKRRAGIRF